MVDLKPTPRRAHIYTVGRVPGPNMSGPSLVIYSQAQALLDLGFQVEIVVTRTKQQHTTQPGTCPGGIGYKFLDATGAKRSRLARAAYWAGWPRDLAQQCLYPPRRLLGREAKARAERDPEALQIFNYLNTANVIPCLPTRFSVYVCHDIESELEERSLILDVRAEARRASAYELRTLRRLRWVEREVARKSGLVLCVSSSEASQIREQWRVPHTAYIPMSIPFAETATPSGLWMPHGVLRISHLGGVDHLPTYLSLEFLLTRVFPLLEPAALSRVQLEVAGRIKPDSTLGRALMEMARPYPQVRFSGFVEEIRDVYGRSDLQAVAATEATGVRTRIIESWAYGLPVLSTTVGAGGVEGLDPGRNILLADDPRDFADNLNALLRRPERLTELSIAARRTYEEFYSRARVADAWRELLNEHLGLDL